MVTYYLSKNLSPRTFLVFMENHGFEFFSPHTFLYLWKIHFLNFRDIGALLEQPAEILSFYETYNLNYLSDP